MLSTVKWETAQLSHSTELVLHGVLMTLVSTGYKRNGNPGPGLYRRQEDCRDFLLLDITFAGV